MKPPLTSGTELWSQTETADKYGAAGQLGVVCCCSLGIPDCWQDVSILLFILPWGFSSADYLSYLLKSISLHYLHVPIASIWRKRTIASWQYRSWGNKIWRVSSKDISRYEKRDVEGRAWKGKDFWDGYLQNITLLTIFHFLKAVWFQFPQFFNLLSFLPRNSGQYTWISPPPF